MEKSLQLGQKHRVRETNMNSVLFSKIGVEHLPSESRHSEAFICFIEHQKCSSRNRKSNTSQVVKVVKETAIYIEAQIQSTRRDFIRQHVR